MCLFRYEEDPEPEERMNAAAPLYVPVRAGSAQVAVRMFRTPLGTRTAVGFTDPGRLASTLGPEQPWIRLSETALRSLIEPLGTTLLTVDPTLTAPAVAEVLGGRPGESSASPAALPRDTATRVA
ncbi:SAV_915 family protein [Streptomyces sp. NPDC096079]|uniref:SAV_915 family protein n=1 Tax=Streptomyces sp. NPDC096079 TaxID=3155820 RepID=UPI003322727F